MPHLKCCGNTWSSGSDDFVVSSLLGVVLHVALLGGLIFMTVIIFDPDCFPDKHQKDIVFAYTCSQYAIQVLVIVSEGLVGFVSSRGTVINDKPRHLLPHFLRLRAFLYFAEALGCAFGGYVAWSLYIQNHIDCQHQDRITRGIRGYVLSSIIILVIIGISFLIYFDPLGLQTPSLIEELDFYDDNDEYDASNDDNDVTVMVQGIQRSVRKGKIVNSAVVKGIPKNHKLYSTNAKKQWLQRVKVLLCCVCSNETRSVEQVLEDIAHSMAILFEGNKLVLSDFVAGLMLVYRDQKERKKDANYDPGAKLKTATYNIMADDQFTPGYKMDTPHEPVDFHSPETTLLGKNIRHYLKFAIGIYGWPAHVYISPIAGTACVCTHLRCRATSRRSEVFTDDNCCLCNTAAMRVRSELTNDEDIIYISFKNEVHLPPFSLCFDHPNKAVVLSIRGSMSLKDALTDLNLSMTSIHVDDAAYHDRVMKVHSGMLHAAKNIKKIIGTRLTEIFRSEQYRDYKLIITGHSLGAGVAAVLAVLYHSRYENLHCYSFSPPGALFTLPLVEYSKPFITTIIYGSDIVPRMTFRGLLYLKRTMVNLLKQCDLPKHAILFPYLFCCYRQQHNYEEFEASDLYNFSNEEEGVLKTPVW
ncbi:diacylglycerol lipase-alpha-like isoform X2 [Dysidea avara]|uniref:diacylglycerol lipase-alpha-like isoform X2 n=1 Tax=Dysidea avara TaxID=196820 RepID=UPI0033276BF4